MNKASQISQSQAGAPRTRQSLSHESKTRAGAWAGAGSFVLWGVLPIFWKQMSDINPLELICHRMVWSLVFLAGLLAWQGKLGAVWTALRNPRLLGLGAVSSVLLAANWLIYVWGVNSGHVVECSLGYFLTPLCNVALGRVVFREQLRRFQWLAIALAAAGVALLLWRLGRLPWIALGLAGTWSLYGVFKKKSALGSLTGLTVETVLLFPLAAAWLVWLGTHGAGALGHAGTLTHVYVLSVGAVTAVPLLLFAYGAQRLRLTTIGVMQFIGPTLQFLIGVFVYHEPFDSHQLSAYALIWAGLALYVADAFRKNAARRME